MSSTEQPTNVLNDFVDRVLAMEVAEQCLFVLMAHDQLVLAQQARATDFSWFALQNLLVAAANISKLLWGTSTAIETKRARLRTKLGVESGTFAIRDRDLRNDFEHFDERVEAKCSTTGIFVGRNIGPESGIDMGPECPREDHFQQFDPTTGHVTFWTHSVSLPAVLKEVEALLPRARELGRGM